MLRAVIDVSDRFRRSDVLAVECLVDLGGYQFLAGASVMRWITWLNSICSSRGSDNP